MRTWGRTIILNDDGKEVEAIQPVIVSASRSTDIPAFFHKWFISRLKRGFLAWVNPFNRQVQYVSFDKTRLVVFWTKNPFPIIPELELLDRKGINYYFQFTVNDYNDEGLEPNVPVLKKRIEAFKLLSELIGKEKVIWRFDPLILTDQLSVPKLISKIARVGQQLNEYTEKLVFSFADIKTYRKVQQNLRVNKIYSREFNTGEIHELMVALNDLNKRWRLSLATCAEIIDLSKYNVAHNKCIDDELIVRLFSRDKELMNFIGFTPTVQHSLFTENKYLSDPGLKDKGQRVACGCIMSKDIGMYNTCSHLCTYCYANQSASAVRKNIVRHNLTNECIITY